MNDFLLELGYSNELIGEIIRFNGENTYANLCFNSDEVIEIIDYLKELGINCISELLIYKIDIFFEDINELNTIISGSNTKDKVDLINNDFTNVDLLFD